MPAFGSQRRGCFQLASYTPQRAHSSPRRPFLLSSASGPASSRNSSATRSAISGAKFHARGPATFTAAFSRAEAKRSLCCHSVPSSPRSTPSHLKFTHLCLGESPPEGPSSISAAPLLPLQPPDPGPTSNPKCARARHLHKYMGFHVHVTAGKTLDCAPHERCFLGYQTKRKTLQIRFILAPRLLLSVASRAHFSYSSTSSNAVRCSWSDLRRRKLAAALNAKPSSS